MWLVTEVQTLMGLLDVFSGLITYSQINYSNEPQITFTYEFPRSQIAAVNDLSRNRFPKDFLFGVSTSAYQSEGAWNEDGKGESVWDHMTHFSPCIIADKKNADISSDSYHKYKEDIQLAKSLGAKIYKISLSWSRILPTGRNDYINFKGLEHYDNVINELLSNDIEPMVTLFQEDLPYSLQLLGGWTNPIMPNWFADYARVAIEAFGYKVKYWITIDSPFALCQYGYGGNIIPAVNQSGYADYLCGHHVLLAHSKVYHMYHKVIGNLMKGKVGIALDLNWFEPRNMESMRDVGAAERAHTFHNDWFLHPIFSETGNYPLQMMEMIAMNDNGQTVQNRLPYFNEYEILQIKRTADFIGINYYSATLATSIDRRNTKCSYYSDASIRLTLDPNWRGESWVKNTPFALRKLLRRITSDYQLPPIFITANGYADAGQVQDIDRAFYIEQHLLQVLDALREDIDIRGYIVRTLVDSFEWMHGYTVRFGLFYVDFHDDTRPRTEKFSAGIVRLIFKTREINLLTNIVSDAVSVSGSIQNLPN